MTPGISTYLFLHRELLWILNSVFEGYRKGEYFAPPGTEITESYKEIFNYYHFLESKSKDKEQIDKLPLINLGWFKSLTDQYAESALIWNKLTKKGSINEDLNYLKRELTNYDYISDNLREVSLENRKLLDEYRNLRNYRFIDLDEKKSQLLVNGKRHDIDFNSQTISFLRILINNNNRIIKYKELAEGVYKKLIFDEVLDKKTRRDLQQVRKKLFYMFEKLKIEKKDISKLRKAIKAVKHEGYRLDSSFL